VRVRTQTGARHRQVDHLGVLDESDERTADQHDAYAVAAWMRHADRDGSLRDFLNPPLTPAERTVAQIDGWIPGVR